MLLDSNVALFGRSTQSFRRRRLLVTRVMKIIVTGDSSQWSPSEQKLIYMLHSRLSSVKDAMRQISSSTLRGDEIWTGDELDYKCDVMIGDGCAGI